MPMPPDEAPQGPSFEPNQGPSLPLAGPSLSGTALRLPKGQGPWTYVINAACLGCRDGRIIPLLGKAWHEAGFGGNTAEANNDGSGYLLALHRSGWQPISHDVHAVAFNKLRRFRSTYLDRHQGIGPTGLPVVYYSDAWERPSALGHLIHWDRDDKGRDDWLVERLVDVCPGGKLADVQIRLATEPLIRQARAAMDRDDSKGKRALRDLLQHLPAEYVPSDLLPAFEAGRPTRPRDN